VKHETYKISEDANYAKKVDGWQERRVPDMRADHGFHVEHWREGILDRTRQLL